MFGRFFTLTLYLFLSLVTKSYADTLHLAVASNFSATMKQLAPIFEQQTGHKLVLSFASSGKLYAQIIHGAPYDVLLSADSDKIERLAKLDKTIKSSEQIYAYGALALWANIDTELAPLTLLEQGSFKRLAMANAKFAPYGKAAQQALTKLAINLNPKQLILGENISQTFQFVLSKHAELGFVALAQVKKGRYKNEGNYWLVPNEYHQAIEQKMAILTNTKNLTASIAFTQFIRGEKAKAIIESYGYTTD